MLRRLLLLFFAALALVGAVWAKGKPAVTAQTFIDRSDAIYYFPQIKGLTDLAVDITIDEFARDPIAGKALITYCYAGKDRRGFVIQNISDAQAKMKDSLEALVEPLGDYVVPRTSVETFADMQVTFYKQFCQIKGQPGTTYFELNGAPTADSSPLKAYRVLVDEQGLAYRVETEAKDGTKMTASIENTHVGDHWLIGKISTRIIGKDGPQWEIGTITYEEVEGYTVPTMISVQHRNSLAQPIKEMPDFTFRFVNYRMNKGAAIELLDKQTPKPAPAS